jgi:hypothetical protein
LLRAIGKGSLLRACPRLRLQIGMALVILRTAVVRIGPKDLEILRSQRRRSR